MLYIVLAIVVLALLWFFYKALFPNANLEKSILKFDGDRLGELMMASKYSFEGKR